ncbi:ISAzo13 family transposase, partial [Rhodopirellula bahusiensis]|uniref:ISAzo13 family transposase n=1 Tax=Rhodopirellula bahusiensis TaxID=2014065 RepID=UPI0032676AA9
MASKCQPGLVQHLREEIETETAGSPVNVGQLWTNRSTRELSEVMAERGFAACPNTIDRLLREELGLGRRQAVKDRALGQCPDRDAQFKRIAELRRSFTCWGQPVISIDTKKKEMLGNFYRPGTARTDGLVHTLDHDFGSVGNGKLIPYGVYDVNANEALMALAQGSDTGELVGDAIRRWYHRMGRYRYGGANRMLVLADAGGSNGCRVGLFREKLWELSRDLGVSIRVAHFPSYCSKYNPIDHRLFSHVSRSLKGIIFRNVEAVAEAIATTKTSTGLQVKVEVMKRIYERGIKATENFLMGNFIRPDDEIP